MARLNIADKVTGTPLPDVNEDRKFTAGDCNKIKTAINEIDTEVTDLTTEVGGLTTKVTGLTTRVSDVETQDDDREQEILGVKRTVDRVSDGLAETDTEVAGLTTKVNDLTTEVGEITTEVDGTREKEIVRELAEAITDINELNDKIITINGKVGTLITTVNYIETMGSLDPDVSNGGNKTVSLAGEKRLDGVVLIGSATTFNRMIPSIIWEKVSGDDGIIISRETSLSPIISNLLAGSYVIKITARYDEDTEVEKRMTLTVNQ